MNHPTAGASRATSALGGRGRAVVVVALALVAIAPLGSPVTGSAQPTAQPAQPTQPSAPPLILIPIPEIAQRAEQAAALLRSAENTPPHPDVPDAEVLLASAGSWIRKRLVSTSQALASSPSEHALATLTDSWQLMRSRLAGLNETLTTHATILQQRVEQLEPMRATWAATRDTAQQAGAPSTVLERIDDTLTAIEAARTAARAQLAYVLDLQDRAVKMIARCDDILAQIARTGHALAGPLLSPDALPIWSPQVRTLISRDLGQRLRDAVKDNVDLLRDFVASQRARTPIQISLFVIVFVVACLARRRSLRRTNQEPSEAVVAQAFALPFSSALVLTLLATVLIYPHPPRVVLSAVGLLLLPPAVLVVRRLAPRPVFPAVHALAAFFLIDRVRDVCSAVPVLEQWAFLLEMVSGIVFLALALRSEHLLRQSGNEAGVEWRRLITGVLWGQLFILVAAVFAGALGYTRLARLLGGEVLESSYLALVLYAGVRVGEGLVTYTLYARPLRNVFFLQRHRATVERRVTLGLRWLAVGTWAYFTLDSLGLMSSILSAGKAVLDARYVSGTASLSLGDVITFALTVCGAFLLSSFLRVLLQEDVYSRFRLPQGASYAVSTIVHYVLVLTGFVFAIAALGIDLNRITILAGAFGVGVGIGLQSVVANFVSGLILLLEGRLHVGDSVQLGTLEGEIREIGSRASTIRTWAGADVIVPNATLTSERVINWTISDSWRRVSLDVGVAYTADPRRVLELLHNVAKAHPSALVNPAPLALCTGFGDSALKFELRVWTALDDAESLLSDLVIGVHGALATAKIEIPFPQRDVHIRNGAGDRGAGDRQHEGVAVRV
jgi:potassium-dependent mechanosensitive channel